MITNQDAREQCQQVSIHPEKAWLEKERGKGQETFPRYVHSVSITFRFLFHYKTGHTLLLSQDEGDVPGFVCRYHLQSQAVHSALAAHLVEIVVLEEVVSEPPLCVCDTRVRQLHLKDGVLPGGHSGVAQLPEDAHTLYGQMWRRSTVTLPEVRVKATLWHQAKDQTTFHWKAQSYSGDPSYIKKQSHSLHLLCFPVEHGDEPIQTWIMGGPRRSLLPFTVTEAEVLLSPVSQVYSPLSVASSLRMAKVWVVALCSMLYLLPSVSTLEPLSQVTLQSTLEVSQVRVILSPSLASQLSSSLLNVTGAAAGKNQFVLMIKAITWQCVLKCRTLNSTISLQPVGLTRMK